MIVCHCRRVNHHRILDAVRQGARDVDEVGRACGAGTGCGGCRRTIDEMIGRSEKSDSRATERFLPACACRAA